MAGATVTSKQNSSSSEPWKLQDDVKLMRVSVSKAYRKSLSLQEEKELTHSREVKKWTKMDVYLFSCEFPVIKYCPKDADMSSMSETVQLDNVVFVKHISNLSKPNVLAINFPSFSLLLSFKTRPRMEDWMSELLCLADIYTLLLHKTSNTSVKLGYYQLQFVLNKVIVCDAITKKEAWTWNMSHICGYSKIKLSGIKLEIGSESTVHGHFSFTGKQTGRFCEQLQMLSYKIAQNRGNTLPARAFHQSTEWSSDLPLLSKTTQTFPRISNFQIGQKRSIVSNQYVSIPPNPDTLRLRDMSSESSNDPVSCIETLPVQLSSSTEYLEQATVPNSSVKRSLSFTDLDECSGSSTSGHEKEEYVIPSLTPPADDYVTCFDGSTSGDEKEEYVIPSLTPPANDYLTILDGSTSGDEKEEYVIPSLTPPATCLDGSTSADEKEEYVIPSLTPPANDYITIPDHDYEEFPANDYLTILPDLINDYEELADPFENIYSEPDAWL